MKVCILSQQHFSKKHVSEATVDAFEKALLSCGEIETVKIPVSEFVWKWNRKFNAKLLDVVTVHKVLKEKPDVIFVMAMSAGIITWEVPLLKSLKVPKVAYCMDTWEKTLPEWESAIRSAGIDYVLCAYMRSVEVFSKICKHAALLPQSMNEKYFYPRDVEKTHLFMQMGRKNSILDAYVHRYLEEHNLQDDDYIREKAKGQIIYPEFEQLAEEINKTMFFLVSPRNRDEASFTGAISDVTARFYEGIACKTLLLGLKPQDTFDELFPSEKTMLAVESYEEFRDYVDYYRERPDEYKELVEFNFQYLMKHHTWHHRASRFVSFINELSILS